MKFPELQKGLKGRHEEVLLPSLSVIKYHFVPVGLVEPVGVVTPRGQALHGHFMPVGQEEPDTHALLVAQPLELGHLLVVEQ
jgi:hypothetical protein